MNYRSLLIAIFTFLGGIYFFLEFILPKSALDYVFGGESAIFHTQFTNGVRTVGAMAVALGLINIVMVHGSRIVFRRKGFINSSVLLLTMLLMLWCTAADWIAREQINGEVRRLRLLANFAVQIKKDAEDRTTGRLSADERISKLLMSLGLELEQVADRVVEIKLIPDIERNEEELFAALASSLSEVNDRESTVLKSLNTDHDNLILLSERLNLVATNYQQLLELEYQESYLNKTYQFLFDGLFTPLGSAMFSLLGFYIISAGYRAFRVRSGESALMMLAAVLVVLGQVPFYIYISSELPGIRDWLLQVPSSAAFRGVKFGAAIAGLIMAFRMWLSIESKGFAVSKGEKA